MGAEEYDLNLVNEAKKLFSGDEVDANGYIALGGVMGIIGWGLNEVAYQLTPQTETGVRPGFLFQDPNNGLWATAIWAVVWLGFLGIAARSVRRDEQFSPVGLIWIVVLTLGLIGNTVAFFLGPPIKPAMMWLAFYGYFGFAYLMTGLMVNRGGIYLAAGLISAVLFLAGLGSHLGMVPLGVDVAHPWPFPYVVLGLLHAVPMIIDGKRGGREMTDQGIPAIKARKLGDVSGGATEAADAD